MSIWRMPWNRSTGPIGLDLGGDEPRAMQIRFGGDAPRLCARVAVAPGSDLVRQCVAAAETLRKSRFVGRDVVVGLPTGLARMHVARLPAMTGPDAAEAVAWEAAERNGIARESLVADAVPTGAPSAHGDGKEEQLVVASAVEPLEEALSALVEAGFDPLVVEPRFMAVARALSRRARRDADQSKVRAVLHIEQQGSSILVLRGDRIAFCREIPVGGETLDHAVASRLGVPVESARELRMHRLAAAHGAAAPVDPVADEAASAAMRATLDSLAGEIALCLRYYGVTFRGGQPSRVVLSGPHGGEPRLASIIEEAARVEVSGCAGELPAAATGALGATVPGADFAPWIAAYGLACRSCERRASRSRDAGREREAA